MRRLVKVIVVVLVLTGFVTERAATQAPPPPSTGLADDFQAAAFSSPVHSARLAESGAIDAVSPDYWDLSGATSVTARYTGWTASDLEIRGAGGVMAPLGKTDVWVVTAHGLQVSDPGGSPACGGASSGVGPAVCPTPRVWTSMMFIVNDATGRVIEASPF